MSLMNTFFSSRIRIGHCKQTNKQNREKNQVWFPVNFPVESVGGSWTNHDVIVCNRSSRIQHSNRWIIYSKYVSLVWSRSLIKIPRDWGVSLSGLDKSILYFDVSMVIPNKGYSSHKFIVHQWIPLLDRMGSFLLWSGSCICMLKICIRLSQPCYVDTGKGPSYTFGSQRMGHLCVPWHIAAPWSHQDDRQVVQPRSIKQERNVTRWQDGVKSSCSSGG